MRGRPNPKSCLPSVRGVAKKRERGSCSDREEELELQIPAAAENQAGAAWGSLTRKKRSSAGLLQQLLQAWSKAVKSLKRNCSTSCRDRNFSYQHEKHRVLGIGRSAFSRFDMKYSSKELQTTDRADGMYNLNTGCITTELRNALSISCYAFLLSKSKHMAYSITAVITSPCDPAITCVPKLIQERPSLFAGDNCAEVRTFGDGSTELVFQLF